MQPLIKLPFKKKIFLQNISKTPLWSRRRPQYYQSNERTEAISSICSSFSNVNRKKEDIEDLKKQLIINEIKFKEKLYELQLEAARKEVEIKTEVLKQIKGRCFNFYLYFQNTESLNFSENHNWDQ